MKNPRELSTWQKGMDIAAGIYKLTYLLPEEEKAGFKTQIRRTAVSIPANIAEGCSHKDSSDFRRYMEIAIGSTYELETDLTIAENIKLISKDKIIPLRQLLSEEQKMLYSFLSCNNETGPKPKKIKRKTKK